MILGIETSCDETAVAFLTPENRELISLVSSQVDLHRKYGGVVPEIASRRHLEVLVPMLKEALSLSSISLREVKAVAVTRGPGLVGALLVGMEAAKALSLALNVPLLGVNHLAGHVYAAFLEEDVQLPALVLIVSGGHTELVWMDEEEDFRQLGTTRDDACGETLDKIARFLGLSYPGGPEIEKMARKGRIVHHFPIARLDNPLDFSFSGIKTALIYFVRDQQREGKQISLEDLCASFQEAIVDNLLLKTKRAIETTSAKRLIVCGGVAANSRLREKAGQLAREMNFQLYIPSSRLCTDNALMIARAGLSLLLKGKISSLEDDVDPNLNLF